MREDFEDIIWGSKLFVNMQFTYKLVSLIGKYYKGKSILSDIFLFIHEIQRQKKVKLYRELSIELDEFLQLEKELKTDNQTVNIIEYSVNRLFTNIIQGRRRLNRE